MGPKTSGLPFGLRGVANPIEQIWCGSMMLEHLGEHEAAAAVLTAIETILAKGRSTLTLDMGGTATPAQLGTAISQERSASRPRR